jgi:hypothetical protein
MAIKTILAAFLLAENAAVVIDPATASQLRIRGLQGMGLCLGFKMETITVKEMGRRVSLVVPTGGTYEETSVNYNFIPGDASLELFRSAALNSTPLTAVRLYSKYGGDFSAPDIISDSASCLYVGSMGDPKTDSPNGLFTGSLSYMPGGPFALFVAHKKGIELSYTAASRTLASSAADFVTKGFEAGDTLILDYADGNDPLYLQAESVAAGAIVFTAGVGDVALLDSDFVGGATTELHGATPQVVSDFD